MTCDGGLGTGRWSARADAGGGTTSRSPTWTDDPIGGGAHLEAATGAMVATRRAGAAVRARTGAPRITARLEAMDCCIG